jgi:general secretion pathway protein A
LLQILLVGQPELDDKLDSRELRQLKQRIALRSHLEPMSEEETIGYIQRRLQLAGAGMNGSELFPRQTIAEVFRYSRGIPRLINTICENSLVNAYARQLRSVTPEIVEEVAVDFRLNVAYTPPPADNNNQDEVSQAVNTLLQLRDHLQDLRLREREAALTVMPGVRKQ